MSQYSEMMGSFIRTGNYPMEANYIFPTEDDLIQFYEDPINKTTMHVGLLRIVDNGERDRQALYWAVPNDDGFLYFEKLVDYNTISNIDELKEKIEQEIQDRIAADNAIWGTTDPTEIDQDLNTILKLSDALIQLRNDFEQNVTETQEKLDTLKNELKATVGTEEDDIIEYLKTLDYESLTKVSETLHYFLDSVDEEKDTIDTWLELQAFLEGFGDKDTLLQILTDLWHNIQGDPLPNTQFRTLRGIQDFVEALSSYTKNRMDNIQTELDQTQVGVGLSGDGAYNADQETYYLKNATSVMNALKILDSLINEAINNCHYESEDSETVKIDIKKEPEKTTIKAWVKISPEPGNDIIAKEDGIYHNIDSEYENGILTIKVNGNIRQQHVLGLSSIVEQSYYDPDQEAIIIVFKLQNGEKQIISIPAGALIQEWEVDNSISTKVVELTKQRVVSGGADKLSADVRISTNKYNILEKDANTLLVRGTSDNIIYDGDVTVKSKLDQLINKDEQIDSTLSNLRSDLDSEIVRAKEAERDIQLALDNEIKRSTDRDELLTEQLNAETQRAKDAEKTLQDDLDAEINRSTNADLQHDKAISEEVNRATLAEHKLQDNIDALNTKVETEITESRRVESELSNKLEIEINRSTLKDEELKNAITEEYNRAVAAETKLTQDLNNEILRSTNQDQVHTDKEEKLTNDLRDLNTKVNNEINRATQKENDLALALQSETDRATKAETELQNNIINEELRATNAESALDHKIDDLKNYLDENYSKDSELSEKVDDIRKDLDQEIIRAKFNEQELSNRIDGTNTALNSEIERAKDAEQTLTNNLSDINSKLESEINRSIEKDNELTTIINNEIIRAVASENAITNNLNSEIDRATAAESVLTKELQDLIVKCISANATTANEAQNALAKLGEKYATVEEIGKTLKAFLEDSDFADSTINKWQEIQSFLSGITDQDTLLGLLQDLTQGNKDDISKIQQALTDEINRAKLAENTLQNNIDKETERATNAENLLDHKIEDVNTAISSEIERATNSEKELLDRITTTNNNLSDTNAKLESEITRSTEKDNELQKNLDLETLRATNAETLLDHKIDDTNTTLENEIKRSTEKDDELTKALESTNAKLDDEITRSTDADADLQKQLDLEVLRATNVESNLDTKIETVQTIIKETINVRIDTLQDSLNQEISRSVQKDSELDDRLNNINISLNNEITRAESAENVINSRIDNLESSLNTSNTAITDISTKLQDEITRSIAKDQELEDSINREKDRAIAAEIALNEKITQNLNSSNSEISGIKDKLGDLTDDFNAHIYDFNNPHHVTKEQLGLDKVDNTSDLEKPVSVAVQKELNDLAIQISQKADGGDFLDHLLNNQNPHNVTKEQVGLGNVDNTSDMNKPISLATQEALDKKSDVGHKHVMSDIEDLENLPIVKGVIELLTELPEDPQNREKWLLKTQPTDGTNARYEIVEYDAVNLRWNQKLLTTGGITCVIDGDVYKLNSSGLERILDVSDYLYFYDKIYDETKDLIEDIDWEENDATNDTNQQIRLKITYKTKYGDPNEDEATNPYKAKAVKYIDIDKSRFLANAYSRPATQDDVNNGYATVVGEPLLILVMTTGDHVTISLKDSLNIYDPVDTPSIDMSVSDWTGTPSTSYKVSADVIIATTQDKTDAISLHILDSTEKGLYSTLHTTNTNSITLTPNYGTAGQQKSLTADLNINNSLNDKSDVLLTIDSSGLSAKVIWGEYD